MNTIRHRRRALLVVFLVGILIQSIPVVHAQDTPGVNDPPDITLPSPAPDTQPVTPVALTGIVINDPDVGGGLMEMEIDISDLDGVGGRSVPAGNYGTFSWGLGSGVTSDIAVTTRAALNAALASFVYTPPQGFSGMARIIFEIDDQGNTGTGGVKSRTRFIDIDVCATGDGNCAVNAQPDVTLPGSLMTAVNTPVTFAVSVSDIDVGLGGMEMEIDIADLDGVGGLSVPAGDYGTFTWGFGSNITSDVEVKTRFALNTALASLTYTPDTGFTGTARIIFEIDDQGNSQTALPLTVLSRTRFIDIQVTPAGSLVMTLSVQGRPPAPDAAYSFPTRIVIKTANGQVLFDNTVNGSDTGGLWFSSLPTGAPLAIWVKGTHTLAVLHNKTITGLGSILTTSVLREGDCNNDNVVNIADFSILAGSFGLAQGAVGFDPRADLNEDNVVNIADFSLLAGSFGQSGAAMP
ncbi:MAG: hypothetical protein JNL42_01855 [Anaerolineae bacterium]|nr:hypothetical protein [Anaerolineae bacterium]